MINEIDTQILSILQDNARISNADIARQVGLTPPAVLERVRKLEKRGLIQGYYAHLQPAKLGLGMLAFVFVKTNERLGDPCVSTEMAKIPEVQEVHHVAGEDCYLAKVRVTSPSALGELLRETFGRIPSVVSTRSTVVLETLKDDPRLAFGSENGDDDES